MKSKIYGRQFHSTKCSYKKFERSQINSLMVYLEALEKKKTAQIHSPERDRKC